MPHLLDLRVVAVSPNQAELIADLPRSVSELIEGGVRGFMMREKSLARDDFIHLGRELRTICDRQGATFILNERWELAELIGARVVHLTWQSQPFDFERDKRELIVGRSIHSLAEAKSEQTKELDYVVAGPVFLTPSKMGLVEPLGLNELAAIRKACAIPVVAIGGIKPGNVSAVARTGVEGVAAISCFFAAANPRQAAAEFCVQREAIDVD